MGVAFLLGARYGSGLNPVDIGDGFLAGGATPFPTGSLLYSISLGLISGEGVFIEL